MQKACSCSWFKLNSDTIWLIMMSHSGDQNLLSKYNLSITSTLFLMCALWQSSHWWASAGIWHERASNMSCHFFLTAALHKLPNWIIVGSVCTAMLEMLFLSRSHHRWCSILSIIAACNLCVLLDFSMTEDTSISSSSGSESSDVACCWSNLFATSQYYHQNPKNESKTGLLCVIEHGSCHRHPDIHILNWNSLSIAVAWAWMDEDWRPCPMIGVLPWGLSPFGKPWKGSILTYKSIHSLHGHSEVKMAQ